jgi:pullulanase
MNEIRKVLDDIDTGILMYGEGWTGGLSPLPERERAVKTNIGRLDPRIAVFSDNLRDGIKGSVFSAYERGFISGRDGMEETIKFGVTAATRHDQIDYRRVLYSDFPWAAEPSQCINYVSAHDNLTLWDKLALSNRNDSVEDRIKMNLLSAAIVLTCQGIPFIQAGEDFLRSKPLDDAETIFDENSYRSPDFVNSLKWDRKSLYHEVFCYYKGLIEFRRMHQELHLTSTAQIREKLIFLENVGPNVVAYLLANNICIIYNANREAKTLTIPEGEWKVFARGMYAGNEILEVIPGGDIIIEPISAMILERQ